MALKRKDKGKAILKEPLSQTQYRESQETPPIQNLSCGIPVKSWINTIQKDKEKSKAITSQGQVNEWIESIFKSPELILALQSFSKKPKLVKEVQKITSKEITLSGSTSSQTFSQQTPFQTISQSPSQKSDWFNKTYQQNILNIEDGFYNPDPFIALSKIFPKGWFFKPWDLTKPQSFYHDILEFTESVKFKHFYLSDTHSELAYSMATILKVITPKQWGEPLHISKIFPAHFQIRLNHCRSFTYWDYQEAWFNTFFLSKTLKSPTHGYFSSIQK